MPWFFNSSHGIATCYPIHKVWAAEMFRQWRITRGHLQGDAGTLALVVLVELPENLIKPDVGWAW